ncbi:hypothetical protein SEVIR_1G029100v4 [Setaria viridis]|uniref:Uncharacterized protein n=2 Tax=Setaria TaxID=4554 RepID=A0A368PG73_SETIT|nr:hypothetical protein SETIT_1G028200v2 [Setaria italica]TKW37127.1 hypothetical protein SEVIR_1G029100v2 [Setaria viridis]
MWPPAWLVAVSFLVIPLTALTPSGRNLTALLPELCGILASLYRHCRHELLLLATVTGLRHTG